MGQTSRGVFFFDEANAQVIEQLNIEGDKWGYSFSIITYYFPF